MVDAMSSEVEVLHFLYQLMVTVKPGFVLETGSYHGESALHIARGLRANGHGSLVSIENDETCYEISRAAIEKAELGAWAKIVHADSRLFRLDADIDVLYCDSDPAIRVKEIENFWPRLTPYSLILVHDVNTGTFLPQRQALLGLGMHTVFLPTPRGLAMCQKKLR